MGTNGPLIFVWISLVAVLITGLVVSMRRPRVGRKLGLPYSVNAKLEGHSGVAELVIRDDVLCVAFALVATGPYPTQFRYPVRVPLSRVRAVRVREVGIAIEYDSLEGPETLVVITREQGAKDRLLWELAVLAPAAVEAGIPEGGSFGAARGGTPLLPTGHAASTSEPPDAARAVLDLDARMTSLGSALAGPVDRPAPPPPRSGLGKGLFVAPPREGGD